MTDKFSIPKRIVFAVHPKMPDALKEAQSFEAFIKSRGLTTQCGLLDDADLRQQVQDNEFDLMVAVGGDGTMLRAAHLCAPWGVPILGVNLGRLGFLFQVQQNNSQEYFSRLLEGKFWIEKRMMLHVEHWRSGETQGNWHALNEAVICRGHYIRPVHISASVDDRLLTTYVADGLIAATPTGSTAYALAAGGPILPPDLRNILLVPIAPHLSVDRAVVLSEGSTVSIQNHSDAGTVLSVDGQTPVGMDNKDIIKIRSGDYSAHFVRFGDPDYFYRNLTARMNQNSTIEFSQ
ncbi:MAG: NAD(+)/NADH kinase [Chloroflexota bacterium]